MDQRNLFSENCNLTKLILSDYKINNNKRSPRWLDINSGHR